MSGTYGPADEAESIATIGAALDAGVCLLDTGDYYGMGHNELLIREALRGRDRDGVVLSVKFGALRAPGNAFIGIDGRPAAVQTSWPTPCNAWAPTTSTSTALVAWTQTCRSRRRLEPSRR
jgi:pyridoxine 4-dehydrogenase